MGGWIIEVSLYEFTFFEPHCFPWVASNVITSLSMTRTCSPDWDEALSLIRTSTNNCICIGYILSRSAVAHLDRV